MLGESNEAQTDQVLRSEVIGRLGCHAQGLTYLVPVTYAYDGDCIYGHSVEGLKVRMMRANPNVCFEVDAMESLANWRSVIAWVCMRSFQEKRRAGPCNCSSAGSSRSLLAKPARPPTGTQQRVLKHIEAMPPTLACVRL